MMDAADHDPILEAIAHGIDVARRNPLGDESLDADRYAAWCAMQELRRAGFVIRPAE